MSATRTAEQLKVGDRLIGGGETVILVEPQGERVLLHLKPPKKPKAESWLVDRNHRFLVVA